MQQTYSSMVAETLESTFSEAPSSANVDRNRSFFTISSYGLAFALRMTDAVKSHPVNA